MLTQKYEVFFSAASFLISEKMDLYVMTGRVYQRRAKKKLAGQTEKSG